MAEEEKEKMAEGRDELAESLEDLFTNLSIMIKGELEHLLGWEKLEEICTMMNAACRHSILFPGTNNQLLLLEKMNQKVAEEYNGYGDVASGVRVFVEQLSRKNQGFQEYVQEIEKIDQQVTEFEAVVSMLDKYTSLLEKKLQSACHYSMPT